LPIDIFGSGKVGKTSGDAADKLPTRPPLQFIGFAMHNRPI